MMKSYRRSDTESGLHVGLIMDGNGRWARRRGLPRVAGHAKVADTIERCVNAAPQLGVRWLTFYAFSTENWNRPKDEVAFLMSPDRWLVRPDQISRYAQERVSVSFIGCRSDVRLPLYCRKWFERVESQTVVSEPHLKVTIAFNYGGRAEILQGLRECLRAGNDAISETDFAATLWSGALPDLDLIVRTSGEYRLSNFMLWKCTYAELVITPILWPDFTAEYLEAAIAEYWKRTRRFGRIAD